MTEVGFRRWVIKNFSELKEHVLTQCKETKNLEKSLEEMLTRITSLEKNINDLMELKSTKNINDLMELKSRRNINDLMELKNTAQELREAYTSFNSQID